MGINNQLKTIVNIPGWAEVFGDGAGLTGGAAAYARIPLVYRCTRLIADSLSSVELKCYKGKGTDRREVDWPFEIDTEEWTWNMISSILLTGAGYTVGLKNVFNRPVGLQWLDPTTIIPGVDPSTGRLSFVQNNAAGGNRREWSAEEMVYIKELRFGNAALPGPSAAAVALDDANLSNNMTKFVSYYFQQGAMPLTIIPLPASTQDNEVKRIEKMWKSVATGIRRAWTVMGLRVGKDGGQPYQLTSPLKDLVMPQLDAKVRKAIADAFGIPITMLDDAANYATASEHNSQFWKTCVRPWGKRLRSGLNKYLKPQYGLYADYAFEELDEFQEDEANRAESVVKLTDAGMPLLVALDVLGYDMTVEQRQAIEKEVERRNAVQERIALAEAGGPPPASPRGGEGSPSSGGSGNDGKEGPPPASPRGGEESPTPQPSPRGGEGVRSALFNWKAAALKAVKTGHALKDLDFDHPAIPEEAAVKIRAALRTCKCADDVHAVFAKARGWCATEIESPLPPFTKGGETTSPRGGEVALYEELKRANDLLELELSR